MLLIRTPGGGPEGLAALEGALALDPELPFAAFPLAQAHLVTGRGALREGDAAAALEHARSARRHDPGDPDFRELAAEALAALQRLDEAIALYADLRSEGRELDDTLALLYQRRATGLLIEGDREAALEHYLAARAAGLNDEGLGFGATLLRERAVEWIDRGIARVEAGEFEPARECFRTALHHDPASVEARNHLGVASFQLGDYRAAAEAWDEVLALAEREGLALPDPVHLDLARAWRLADEPGRARAALSVYLDREPEGEWSGETRRLLELLEAEQLGWNERR